MQDLRWGKIDDEFRRRRFHEGETGFWLYMGNRNGQNMSTATKTFGPRRIVRASLILRGFVFMGKSVADVLRKTHAHAEKQKECGKSEQCAAKHRDPPTIIARLEVGEITPTGTLPPRDGAVELLAYDRIQPTRSEPAKRFVDFTIVKPDSTSKSFR